MGKMVSMAVDERYLRARRDRRRAGKLMALGLLAAVGAVIGLSAGSWVGWIAFAAGIALIGVGTWSLLRPSVEPRIHLVSVPRGWQAFDEQRR